MLYHDVFFTLQIFNHAILLFAIAAFSILYMAIVSMIIHGSQSPYVGNFFMVDHGQICAIERMSSHSFTIAGSWWISWINNKTMADHIKSDYGTDAEELGSPIDRG